MNASFGKFITELGKYKYIDNYVLDNLDCDGYQSVSLNYLVSFFFDRMMALVSNCPPLAVTEQFYWKRLLRLLVELPSFRQEKASTKWG
ncbi:MAG: hypothetical protein V7749_12015 [Cocleimonas sp.]|jgi:hypothetical protein